MGQTDEFMTFDDSDQGRMTRRERELFDILSQNDPLNYVDEPSEAECDMCGKPNGATLRPDGQRMCSSCWTIWNG